jgi:hypothetical protein
MIHSARRTNRWLHNTKAEHGFEVMLLIYVMAALIFAMEENRRFPLD